MFPLLCFILWNAVFRILCLTFMLFSNVLLFVVACSCLCLSIPVCLLVNVGSDSGLSPRIVGENHKTLLVFWAWSFPLPGVHLIPGLNLFFSNLVLGSCVRTLISEKVILKVWPKRRYHSHGLPFSC